MKIITLLLSLFFLVCVSNGQKKPVGINKNQRVEKLINSQWTFNYFPVETADKGYESPGFDDSKWIAVSLPHTWSTYETTGEVHPFIRNASETDNPYWWIGWGWYRKHFSINRNFSGKKVFVEFEGVQKYCKVWVNGKYLGEHKGGYGSFDFDITQYLKPDGENVIAVAVNNSQKDQYRIPPMAAGSFNVYGGIYRNVTIVLKNSLYIPMQGSAGHEGGTFITTPEVTEKSGTLRVQTWVKNDNLQKNNCILQTSIFDASKKLVQVIKTNAVINPGQLFKFDQTSKPIRNPHLWSNDDPYLYNIYSEVIDGKETVDTYTSTFGFRWFRWDHKENFLYVNGKKVFIHGGNRLQEYPWLGDAIPDWITVSDYTDIAENLNYNFMATGHYPNDKLVYDLADRYGIIIDDESPSIGNQSFSSEVQEQQMKEMIRRDRNHPSIMFWSMGNETNNAVDAKFALAEDSTRIITAFRATNGSSGEYLNSPLGYVNPEGYVDMYRIPKYGYYFWQATYAKKPMVFIQPHFWRSQYLGQKKDIVVNSNCDKVELKVNGVSKGILTPDESNSHSVTFKDVLIDKGIITASGSKNGTAVTSKVVMAGDPAMIILKSSHKKISADRGSVAIITADIVDSKGNHVYGANNTIKWTLTGPAKFVGPWEYESDIYRHHEMEGVLYIDMPVANIIRPTGQVGKIHVAVSASGLASGWIDLDTEEIKPDNSVVSEPLLDDEGRKLVSRLVLKVNRLDEVPREIKLTSEDLKLSSSDKPGYAKVTRELILKNNPSTDTSTVEFKSLIDVFSEHLFNNNGSLMTNDYNFSIDHYNNCRLISGYINSTKLPPLFKEGLRKFYSKSVIREGNEKNAGEEMNWLNWIPSGGTVIISDETGKIKPVKGAVITAKSELADLIAIVYPGFVNFSIETKERDLEFITKMNPYIHVTSIIEPGKEGNTEKVTKVSYKAEKGQPVLIPLLKFISE